MANTAASPTQTPGIPVNQYELFRTLLDHYLKSTNPAADNPNATVPGAVAMTTPDGGAAPVSAPGGATTPPPKTPEKPPQKAAQSQPQVPTALTDSILNMNQIMPVIKAVAPSGLDGGKKSIAGAADAMQKIGKIMQLFA